MSWFTMLRPVVIYPLLCVVLAAIAIYVQVTSSTLTLPLSTGTTVLTIILPFIAAANIFYTPILSRVLPRRVSPSIQQLLPPALQIIQGVITIIIATVSFEGFMPGQNLNCNLEGNWQRLWHEHDGRAIERIQNSFSCCGFNSIQDRPWPPKPLDSCSHLYNRHSSCASPWRSSMQRNSGLEFGITIAVGLIQLVHLVLYRLRSAPAGGARNYRRLPQSISADPSDRLIEHGDVDTDDDEAEGTAGQNGSNRAYGAIDDGRAHRVEPSGLGEDVNQWRS